MDLHSFHIIAEDLAAILHGARVEKIHAPEPGVHVFSLFTQGLKIKLFLKSERKAPLLFFSGRRLENPQRPSAQVMRLRKYFSGRRLGDAIIHPTERRLAFSLFGRREDVPDNPGGEIAEDSVYLQLDLVNGPEILFDPPEDYAREADWPDGLTVDTLCGTPMPRHEKEGAWQEYAVLTPQLRETLSFLDPPEGRALLVDLEAGGGDLFLYADASGRAVFYSAWPLPDEALKRRALQPCTLEEAALFAEMDDPALREEAFSEKNARFREQWPRMYAASLVDERLFFADYLKNVQKEQGKPEKKAAKRLARLLDKLDQEEKRLGGMFALREKAIALQGALWMYPPEARLSRVELPDGSGLELDPLMTVRENMARMFHQSGRGKRGLTMLEARRAELAASGIGERKNTGSRPLAAEKAKPGQNTGRPVHRLVEHASGDKGYKDVARFTSSDGFTLLRGKNARGNHSLLKIGKGHDLWLHVEEGPGAHVIIRRAHEGEQVPESTLMEAARLAAEKSWQGSGEGVRIMYAQLRHVRPIKGGGPGMVKVDVLAGTFSLGPEKL